MEILQNFGFKPELFIAQIVNFLILAYLFKRFLYKPILTVLRERQEIIKKGLSDSEKASILKSETESQRTDILRKTRIEADKIISETKQLADTLKKKNREEVKKETEKMISDAKQQALLEMQKMERQIKTMSIELSSNMLRKITKELFTEDERKVIVKRSMEKLGKN